MLDALAPSDPSLDQDAAPPSAWTPGHVGRRLVEAMRTLDRLPRPRGPRAPGNGRSTGSNGPPSSPSPSCPRRSGARLSELALRPSGLAIDRMDRALEWLRLLRATSPDLALVATLWAHRSARGRSLRALCRERGWTPQTFHNRKTRALTAIAAALETRGEPVF